MSSARPSRRSWSRPSNRLLNLIKERIRLTGQDRAAASLRTSVDTMLTLRDGGTVTPEAVARLEAIAAEHVKSCGCGRHYNREQWSKLEYVGLQSDGDDGHVEMRNCSGCDSTLGIDVGQVAA
jgi:hypothetical protein